MRQRDFTRRAARLGATAAIACYYFLSGSPSSSLGQDTVVKKVEAAQPAAATPVSVNAGTAADAVTAMMNGLKGLQAVVPGIASLTVGSNFSDRNKGYTHGLIVRFQDRAALDGYIPHPAHREVVEKLIRPIVEDVLAVDFES